MQETLTIREEHAGRLISPDVYDFDYEALRRGYYSDAYFLNGARVLEALSRNGARFAGENPRADVAGLDLASLDIGDIEAEMQFFTKRRPWSLAAGIDAAIAILRECTGWFDSDGRFTNTAHTLEIVAVREGAHLRPWEPAMKVRGRYRDFAAQETTTLGVMARATLVATNVYRTLEAGGGKPLLFFPARFDVHTTQSIDGYAYKLAVETWNREHNADVEIFISTDAQGKWWGGSGGGTVAHAFVLCFLADTAEAMLAFASHIPPDVRRIALVDTNNDCVGDSIRAALAYFRRYIDLTERGDAAEAARYVLYGVRVDTPARLIDASIGNGGPDDHGVNPKLIRNVREALDGLHEHGGIPQQQRQAAREFFRNVRIVASSGFDDRRVAGFEKEGAPVDMYGIGTYFISGSNAFTADIVRVKICGEWHDMAKVGRWPRRNSALERVQ